tara:strand:+ start:4565 stop:6595 length:2031 start_codon:yes stop_codon:yes gene_type:complete
MSEEVYDLFGGLQGDSNSDRVKELEEKVAFYRDLYYNHPEDPRNIEDDEFDAYEDELRSLHPESDALSTVGSAPADTSPWEKATHRIKMASLDKVNTPAEAEAWMQSRYTSDFILEEKMDGLSLSLDFERGVLVRAVTRGRGKQGQGEDITRNVKRMKGVKSVLPARFTGSCRAECMMLLKDFEEYNQVLRAAGKDPLKTARNSAAGIARRFNGEGVNYLTVFFYEVEPSSDSGLKFHTQQQKLTYLGQTLKLPTPGYVVLGGPQKVTVERVYKHYESGYRAKLPYEIDGLVIKANNLKYARQLDDAGSSQKSSDPNPKSQVALKFSHEKRITKAIRVCADFGLGGGVTPVAEIEPVEIGGATITRASLSTWSRMEKLKLYAGCPVLVSKRNDIIPYVEKSLQPPRESDVVFTRTTHCPLCNSKLKLRAKADGSKGKLWTCVNQTCPGIVSGKVSKWVKTLDIKHFGQKSVISKLMEAGKVRSISDLYTVTDSDAAEICGRGIAKRAFTNLRARATVTLAELVGSLSIRGIGVDTMQKIVEAGYDLPKLQSATVSELASIDQIGEATAEALIEGLSRERDELERLCQYLTVTSPQATAPSEGVLQGKSFCVTGSLSMSKKKTQQMVEEHGGTWHKSVTKSTAYLIAEDPDGNSSKLMKARRQGVTILSEIDFRNML